MLILYTTDWHIREDIPLCRIDDYISMQDKKLNEIVKIKNKYKPDISIHGGDIVHRWKSSPRVENIVLNALSSFDKMYLVPGNHDMCGLSLSSLIDSSLGVFQTVGGVDILEELDGEDVKIIGIRARRETTLEPYTKIEKGKYTIVVSHDMITPTTDLPYEHIYYDHLDGVADVVLCGHYHLPFNIRGEKTLFLNPGSLMRMTVDERSKHRIPQVILLDTEKNEVTTIPLSCAEDSEVVFKERSSKEEFSVDLESVDVQEYNLLDELKRLGKERGCKEEVIAEVLRRVESMQAQI